MNCPVCGSPVSPTDTVCRTCGAPLTAAGQTNSVALPAGTTLLGGQYRIDRVLGQGGFGITYEGQDTRLGLHVAIKELFLDGSSRRGRDVYPPGSVSRGEYEDTKKRFLDEAKTLASFNDPSIVRVYNYFEENGTAYLVMEFLEGATLGAAIEKRGPVPPEVVLEIARNMAHTLELVHGRGLLHRDIKPDNIFLHKSGRIVLIDFGSVRSFASGQATSHTRLITPGYAPLEQYSSSARFGPYTDFYALGATLLHALTGTMPPPATDLINGTPMPALPASTPPQLRRAIEKMMALRVEDRPQDAHALLDMLRASPTANSPAANSPAQQIPTSPAPAARTPAVPIPQPVPQPQRQPAQQRSPAPQPVPQPVPQPIPTLPPQPSGPLHFPGSPAPATTPTSGRPLARNILLVVGVLAGAAAGIALAPQYLPTPLRPTHYALAGVGGAVAGLLFALLLWFALPVALPLGAAVGVAYLALGAAIHWPTAISLGIIAAVVALFILKFIRRINW